jgi:ketosteroid isomerase-like protein
MNENVDQAARAAATQGQILDLARQWVAAEQQGDTALLDRSLTDDFVGIGPFGFALSKQDWLQRYRNGLAYQTLTLEDPQVRDYGAAAVLVGVQAQHATYGGQVMEGRFRLTLIWVREPADWRLAGYQLSGPIPEGPPRRA